MDYKITYDKTFNELQESIKDALISAASNKRSFNYIFNEIDKKNQTLIIINPLKSNKNLSFLEEQYRKKLSSYRENAVELTLQNEIYPEFNKFKIEELPLNYSFQNFLLDLGALDGVKEIARLFSNQSRLFEMMFELNDFTNFEIKEYDTVLDNTKLFKKLQQRLYPEIKTVGKLKKYVEQKSPIDPIFNLLTNEEKILLLNIVYSAFTKNFDKDKPNKIPLTDFARIIYLTKDCVDLDIFEINYANRTFYKRLSKGILYSENISHRNNLIENLLSKIDTLKLKSMREYIENEKPLITKSNKK